MRIDVLDLREITTFPTWAFLTQLLTVLLDFNVQNYRSYKASKTQIIK